MTDSSQLIIDTEQAVIKLKNSIDQLVQRNEGNSNSSALLAEAMSSFKNFFDSLKDAEFNPIEFKQGDTPRSEDYNSNLRQIYNDISRFYRELKNLGTASVKSFNYSQVVITEIKKRAESLAGIVLDLNILSNFTRGDVIVAGDDFTNLEKIDTRAEIASDIVELISNGAGISLARSSTNNLTSDPRISVQITPISPQQSNNQGQGGSVNNAPTPGNFDRFYEGCYYNTLGAARPEGGEFNIKEIVTGSTSMLSLTGSLVGYQSNTYVPDAPTGAITPMAQSVFVEYGASEEQKQIFRNRMFDNNPDTFWECEYVRKLEDPLGPDVSESLSIIDPSTGQAGGASIEEAAFQVDVNSLNLEAIERDNIDFSIEIIVTLPTEQNVNFVSINPVLFSKNAFIDVTDISTSNESQGAFTTVDGWESLRFPKTLTPEANEYLTDSQLTASLAPTRFAYAGQGVYPFPTRIAKRIKITLFMDKPTAQVYEKTYALLKRTVDLETTVTTKRVKKRL